MKVAIDWDGTLVDGRTQEWLPGAEDALNKLLMRGDKVFIHTARANWLEGVQQVTDKLGPLRAHRVIVEPKPAADVYVDNQAVRFTGDWDSTLREIWRQRKPTATEMKHLRTVGALR